LSILPDLLERLISTNPLWIGFAGAWFIITGVSAKAFKKAVMVDLIDKSEEAETDVALTEKAEKS